MKRIVVLGGTGFFGGLIAGRLRAGGLQPIVAARSAGEMQLDANNPDELRKNLKQRDLVIDAAGPYQTRTPALIETAMRVGFDVIDLSDSPEYSGMIYEREAPITASGIRVLTACSGMSTVSALIVQASGIENPSRIEVFLRPASRITANPGAIASFLRSIEGVDREGLKVKSVDTVTLPRVFPSLKRIDFIVDTGHTSGNFLLQFAWFRQQLERRLDGAAKFARRVGNRDGVIRFQVSTLLRGRTQTFSGPQSYMLAVIPAILAATAIAAGQFTQRGLVPPTQHVDYSKLLDALHAEGIQIG
jgi:saccharopine dehydrogenase-like protein